MAKEKIAPGKYVELAYDLCTVEADGSRTAVHTVEAKEPENFIFGVTPGLVEGLARALDGLEQGAAFDVTVPAELGFLFNPADVVTLPIDIFLDDEGKLDKTRVKVGEPLPMITGDGYQITGVVKEITPESVSMDFNHPLVGETLHFKGTVLTVRDASPEELKPYFAGCGGGCGGGGCCGGGSCGDSAEGGCCGGCE